jgi:uncharacterized protein YbbK (DUF523 family)
MEKILISACLLGERVRYHGGDARIEHPLLRRWHDEGRLVSVCPEVVGGLTTPRPAAEIVTAAGDRRVLTVGGNDVTEAFEHGAATALDACRTHNVQMAILKDGSPSCGTRSIYDGTFNGRRIDGRGVTAAALIARGITVFSEREIDRAADYLATLEGR